MDEEDLVLEEAQSKAYNPLLGKYNFKVDVAGVKSLKSPELEVLKKGVRLHISRHGLINNNSTTTTTINPPGVEQTKEVIISNNFPELQHFDLTTTSSSTGYIYLFNEADPDLWFEYHVDEHMMIRGIELKNNRKTSGGYKDIREVTTKGTGKNYIIPNKLGKHYFVFTPIQWPIAYIKKLLKNKRKKLKKRAKLIDLNPLAKANEAAQQEVYSYKQVQASFTQKQQTEQHRFDSYLKDIHAFENANDPNATNTHYEDLFISINDPIAAAYDICESIETEVNKLKAMVLTSKTGLPEDDLFEEIQNLKEGEKVFIPDTKDLKEKGYMYSLAAATYKYVYDDEDLVKKHIKYKKKVKTEYIIINSMGYDSYGGTFKVLKEYEDPNGKYDVEKGISKEKLFKILGIHERKAQRDLINEYREDLGNLLLSDYYQDIFDDFKVADAIGLGTGKEAFSDHIAVLGQYPNFYDHNLDLAKDFKPEDDKWLLKIGNTLTSKKEFKKALKVLDAKADITDAHLKSKHSILKKGVSVSKKICSAFIVHGIEGITNKGYKTLQSRISWFRNFKTGDAYLRFKDPNFRSYLSRIEGEITSYNPKGLAAKTKVDIEIHEINVNKNVGKIPKQQMEAFVKTGSLEIKVHDPKYQRVVESIVKSPEFGSMVLLFELVSLNYAIKKWRKKPSKLNFSLMIGAGIKVSAASLELIKLTGQLKVLPQERFDRFDRRLKKLKIVASLVTVVATSISAIRHAGTHDYDAALASSAAALASSAFVWSDIAILRGAKGLGVWPAAVVGGTLMIFHVLSIYYKDSEITAYFKNFPLSNVAINPESNETTSAYIERLYKERQKTVTTSAISWLAETKHLKNTDFETAYIRLFDLIAPGKLVLAPASYDHKRIVHNIAYTESYGHWFAGSVKFAQYFQYLEELEIIMRFYPNGIGNPALNSEKYFTKITSITYKIINKKNEPSTFEFEFKIPNTFTHKQYKNGEVLILCRLITGKNEYIPLEYKGKKRYYCANALTYNFKDSTGDFEQDITYEEALDKVNYQPLRLRNGKTSITIVDEDNIINLTT